MNISETFKLINELDQTLELIIRYDERRMIHCEMSSIQANRKCYINFEVNPDAGNLEPFGDTDEFRIRSAYDRLNEMHEEYQQKIAKRE